MTVMAFAMTWLTGVIVAALPCALLALLARQRAVRNLHFYLIAGVGVGMKQVGAGFAIAGGLAGLKFWKRAGQHYH
ncbi:hypothetical protein AWB80_05316 [Caballeronia pedi]|uniref:Uncharacterized protein n=2 Tax=Caballeronia pedi TaxID=1777141 RepID=A0A158CJY5_9BURK|nr:hypothetical protein AWB80_05316 [Caballeronia pedi]